MHWSLHKQRVIIRATILHFCNYFSNNPLHPSISNQILQTLFYAFSLAMTRRICLTIKASQVSDHFAYSHDVKL